MDLEMEIIGVTSDLTEFLVRIGEDLSPFRMGNGMKIDVQKLANMLRKPVDIIELDKNEQVIRVVRTVNFEVE